MQDTSPEMHTPSSQSGSPAAWIVTARDFKSTFAHDLAEERARRWIDSAPFSSGR